MTSRKLTRSMAMPLARPLVPAPEYKASGGAFDPASLFVDSRIGWLRNPNVAGGVAQLADGTTEAAADGDPVGYVKDFGPGAWHLTNSNTPTKGVLRVDAGGIKSVEVSNQALSKVVQNTDLHAEIATSFTWYFVCDLPSGAAGGLIGVDLGGTAQTDPLFMYPGASDLSLRANNVIFAGSDIGLVASSPAIIKMVHNEGAGTITYGVVGGSSVTVSANPYFMAAARTIAWGGTGGSHTARFAFDQLIDAVLTEQETTDLETWLTSTFGAWEG